MEFAVIMKSTVALVFTIICISSAREIEPATRAQRLNSLRRQLYKNEESFVKLVHEFRPAYEKLAMPLLRKLENQTLNFAKRKDEVYQTKYKTHWESEVEEAEKLGINVTSCTKSVSIDKDILVLQRAIDGCLQFALSTYQSDEKINNKVANYYKKIEELSLQIEKCGRQSEFEECMKQIEKAFNQFNTGIRELKNMIEEFLGQWAMTVVPRVRLINCNKNPVMDILWELYTRKAAIDGEKVKKCIRKKIAEN